MVDRGSCSARCHPRITLAEAQQFEENYFRCSWRVIYEVISLRNEVAVKFIVEMVGDGDEVKLRLSPW